MNSIQITALAMAALEPDATRKRDADKAGNKMPHNRARYLVNLVAEAAQRMPGAWTDEDLLQAAALVARLQRRRVEQPFG